MAIKSSVTYTLPAISDSESDPFTWTAVNSVTNGALPVFIVPQSNSFVISPSLYPEVGTHQVKVILNDTLCESYFYFSVTVTNQPPHLLVNESFSAISID